MKLPRISILTPTLAPYDAIGNDIVRMREILSAQGYPVRVFAEGIHAGCAAIAEPLSSVSGRFWQSAEDVLIYHHSTGWAAGEQILFNTTSRIILRYHNITPPLFFARYSQEFQEACTAGLAMTGRMARLPNIAVLGASTFNCSELMRMGVPAENCRVLAPLHRTEELAREPFDIPTIQRYAGEMVNILFVGGIKPNKGHRQAIRAFAAYRHEYNDRSRLIFAGGMDDRLRLYVAELRQLAARLGVGGQVVFTGAQTPSQLKSLYVAADVFLSTSEHEGFCVPLVEAMYFRVPIVALATTAIPETLGDAGTLLAGWNESQFAAAIAQLIADPDLAMQFGEAGRRRYQEAFSSAVLEKSLNATIAELLSRPSAEFRTAGSPFV